TRSSDSVSGEQLFVTRDQLSSELGDTIADAEVTSVATLDRVDALLKRGAHFNDAIGPYGTDPLEAAIRRRDVDLLQALIERGLRPNASTRDCPIYWAAGHALKPGGDEMVRFLLENGMALDCLIKPRLVWFLQE